MLKVPFYDGSGGDVHMIVSCLTASEIAQIYTDYTVLHTTLETLITARGGFTDEETEAFETVTGDMHLEQVLLASDLIDSIFPSANALYSDFYTEFDALEAHSSLASACIENEDCSDTTIACTPAPSNFTAVATDNETSVELNWDDTTNAVGYNVYRAISIDNFTLGALNGTTALTETTYTDTTASDNVTYYYTVTAVDPNGNESEPAVIVDAILNEVAVSVNNTNLIDNIVTRNRFFVGSYVHTENDTTQTHNARYS